MLIISSFLSIVEAYAAADGVAESTISSRVFNDGKRLGQIRRGADVGARRIEGAMQWFSDHWPANAEWPADVPRPAVSVIAEAAE